MKPFTSIKQLLTTLFFLLVATSLAYGQTVTIKGRVMDTDNEPIPGINITLKGSPYGAATNQQGHYEINDIPAGIYTLVVTGVGYQSQQKTIEIDPNETLTVNITLSTSSEELQEIVVQGTEVNKFAAEETDYVARMPLKNLENPQVYSTVNEELMEEQIMTDIKESVQAAPGVVPREYVTGSIAFVSRGFMTWNYARNGMATVVSRSGTDIVNLERIEFIKGPSGTLFGNRVSSFGGVVNLVTKKPFKNFSGKVGYSLGSFQLSRFTTDINTPINGDKTALLRVNMALQSKNNFNHYGNGRRFVLAPSFSYQITDRLSFLFDVEIFEREGTLPSLYLFSENSGFESFKQLPIDYKESFFKNDLESDASVQKYFARANYQISENWKSSTRLSFINEHNDHNYQPYVRWVNQDVVLPYAVNYGPRQHNYVNLQQNFTGHFRTGPLQHKVLVGGNYEYQRLDEFGKRPGGDDFSPVPTANISDAYGSIGITLVNERLEDPSKVQHGRFDEYSFGAYISDVVQFGDQLSAMLSLRIDRFHRNEGNGIYSQTEFSQTALSPKFGLVFEPLTDIVSLFGNYMNGYQNNAPVVQPDGSRFIPGPEYADQWEGGIKTKLFNEKLTATLSYYRIGIDNAVRQDNEQFTIQDGEQVSKGVEAEVAANPVPGLNLTAGYSYNENKIVKATVNEGNLATNAPQHIANYWASYTFWSGLLDGLGLGFGGNYVSKSFYNAANTVRVPAYKLWNATVFYNTSRWRLGLKFNNISDEHYWDVGGNAQAGRNFVGNITFRF